MGGGCACELDRGVDDLLLLLLLPRQNDVVLLRGRLLLRLLLRLLDERGVAAGVGRVPRGFRVLEEKSGFQGKSCRNPMNVRTL